MECADDSCIDEVLEGQLFCIKHHSQITTIEDLQCPSGCGRLSYGRVGWSDQFWAIIIAAGATAWVAIEVWKYRGLETTAPWLILLAIPLAVLAFASNEGVTGRYKCDKCLGEMYDSKTMVETMSTDKATTIERLLESGTPSPNKRQCPRCEEGMVRISIDYVEPDLSGGSGTALDIVVSVVDAMIPNPTNHLDVEGCQTCGTFWFDSGELAKIKGSKSMEGGS
jgi:hypothetical protein